MARSQSKITRFDGNYAFLSNFAPCPIEWEGSVFPTVEHAFQAAKTLCPSEHAMICNLETPASAKRAGRKITLRSDWDQIKVAVMAILIRKKFRVPKLREQLLNTGDSLLVEGNMWGDDFWGVDLRNNQGINWLGRILVLERAHIRLEASDQQQSEPIPAPGEAHAKK